ncbi:MAG TPA: hypothetical protein VF601_00020 [Beijerinckiaceae bacterium]|jgi:magnesium-transporting ATPase (P-type)
MFTETISPAAGSAVAERLDEKAETARKFGMFYVVCAVGLGIVILVLFYVFSAESGIARPGYTLSEMFTLSLVTAVLRIGMVLIAIFLIQILVSFARYYFRIAEHISLTSELVRVSAGNVESMKSLSSVFLPTIEFGKLPSSPVQRVVETAMETVKELAQKLPSK